MILIDTLNDNFSAKVMNLCSALSNVIKIVWQYLSLALNIVHTKHIIE